MDELRGSGQRDAQIETDDLKGRLDRRERKRSALRSLGETCEHGTHKIRQIVAQNLLRPADVVKLNELEKTIYGLVDELSPGEVSTIRVLHDYDESRHPRDVHESNWGGDKTLIIFSEKIKLAREFIKKHSVPETT